MVEVPSEISAALAAHTDEPVLAAIRTSGAHPFGAIGEEPHLEPLWCLVTASRAWIVSVHEEDSVVWGWGGADALRIERGWVTDAISLGHFTLGLRPGSRRAVNQLWETWIEQPRAGSEVRPPEEPPRPAARSSAARAAVGLPVWWAGNVPGKASSRWLFAFETASVASFPRSDGQPVTVPVWLGISDDEVVMAAWDEGEGALRYARAEAGVQKISGTRTRYQFGRVRLLAPLMGQSMQRCALAMAEATPPRRWAHLAEYHLDQSRPRHALLTWEQACARGRDRLCWPGIARMAWAVVDTKRAHRALTWALQQGTLVAADRSEWAAPLSQRARALPTPQAEGAALADLLGRTIDDLPVSDRPSLFPEPAASEAELWVGALAALGRWTDAQAGARALSEDARGLEVVAALKSAEEHTQAHVAWREAAVAWHEAGHHNAALRCLKLAMSLSSDPGLCWIAASWCLEAEQRESAVAFILEALEADPEGAYVDIRAFSKQQLVLVAETAQEQACWSLAARSLGGVLELGGIEEAVSWSLAEILADRLQDHESAASLLAELAEHLESRESSEHAPSAVWLRVAALREGEAAQEALRRAVMSDYLNTEVWSQAAARGQELGLSAWADWCLHVASVTGGGREMVREPPNAGCVEGIDFALLHPGGRDWLSIVRRTLDPAVPPSRQVIVRGLERLDVAFPEVHATLCRCCDDLGLPHVDAFVYRGEGAWGMSAWPTEPPVVLVGHDHLSEGPRKLDDAAIRFLLCVELAHLRCDHPLLALDEGLVGTSQSMYAAFGRFAGPAENLVDLMLMLPGIDQVQKVQRIVRVSRKVFQARSAIDKAAELAGPVLSWLTPERQALAGLGREGFSGSALQMRIHADRVALWVTGDVRAALRGILASSTSSAAYVSDIERIGLAEMLAEPPGWLASDEAIRFGAMMSFAAEHGPFRAGNLQRDLDSEERA